MPNVSAVIGRVAIKVLPDTSNFRKELQVKLEQIEKRVEIKVPAKLDKTQLKRQALEAIRELNAEIRGNDAYKVKLGTKLDTAKTRMRPEIRRAVREYQALAKDETVKLKTELVAAEFELKLDEQSKEQLKQELDHFKRQNSPVKIKVEFDWSQLGAARTKAQLKLLTRPRFVDIIPRVSKVAMAKVATALAALSGGRMIHDKFIDPIKDFLKDLDRSIPKIAALGLGLAGLAGWGATATANLFALGSSIAQIAEASLALPGILGGMAVGLTVTIIAFKDFKKYVPEVSAAWKKLKATISENFWSKAQKPIRQMIDGLLPLFVRGFAVASTAIGGYFGALAKSLQRSFNGPVGRMFADLAKSVQINTRYTGYLANIITILGQAGAAELPRLAKWFGEIQKRMSNWLTEAQKDGSLKGWIDNGIEQLKALGRALKQTGRTLSGLSRAMENAGGSTLSMFADTMGKIAKVVNSPGFQKGASDFFIGAFEAMHNIAAVGGAAFKRFGATVAHTFAQLLPTVGATIGQLVKMISDTLGGSAVQGGLRNLFDGIETAVFKLEPAFKALSAPLGALLTLVGRMAAAFAGPLAATFQALGPVFTKLTPVVGELVDILSTGLTQAISAVSPALRKVTDAILAFLQPVTRALKPAIDQMIPAFRNLADIIASVASDALPKLGDAAAHLIQVFATFATAVMNDLASVWKVVGPIVSALASALSTVAGWLTKLTSVTQGAAAGFVAFLLVMKSVKIVSGMTMALGALGLRMSRLAGTSGAISTKIGTMGASLAAAAGPIGAVAAVGVGLGMTLNKLFGSSEKNTVAFDDLARSAKGLRDEIAAANGVITDSIRVQVAKQLSDSGLADFYKGLGVSLRDLTDSVLKGGDALDHLSDKLGSSGILHDKFAGELKKVSDAYSTAGGRAKDLIGFQKELGVTTDDTADSMSNATDSMAQQTTVADDLRNALDSLSGKAISAKQQELQLRDAASGLTQKIKDQIAAGDANAKSLNENTVAGRGNVEAILDLITKANSHAQAVADQTRSVDAVTASMKRDRQAILDAATAAGLNKDQVKRLIETYGLVPDMVKTQIQLNAGKAQDIATDIWSKLRDMNGRTYTAKLQIQQSTIKNQRMADKLDGFAKGTKYAPGGIALVGEEGPEIVDLPKGSGVTPTRKSTELLNKIADVALASGGGGGDTHDNRKFEYHVHGGHPLAEEDLFAAASRSRFVWG